MFFVDAVAFLISHGSLFFSPHIIPKLPISFDFPFLVLSILVRIELRTINFQNKGVFQMPLRLLLFMTVRVVCQQQPMTNPPVRSFLGPHNCLAIISKLPPSADGGFLRTAALRNSHGRIQLETKRRRAAGNCFSVTISWPTIIFITA